MEDSYVPVTMKVEERSDLVRRRAHQETQYSLKLTVFFNVSYPNGDDVVS